MFASSKRQHAHFAGVTGRTKAVTSISSLSGITAIALGAAAPSAMAVIPESLEMLVMVLVLPVTPAKCACWRFDDANIDPVQSGECDAGHSNMAVTFNAMARRNARRGPSAFIKHSIRPGEGVFAAFRHSEALLGPIWRRVASTLDRVRSSQISV